MEKQQTLIFCDHCERGLGQIEAVVRCEVHELDLCEPHLRRHFDRATCRLVPVDQREKSA